VSLEGLGHVRRWLERIEARPAVQRGLTVPEPRDRKSECVQNILLACRAVGLGASLTTIHHMFEEELAQHLGVPDEVPLVALLPIGFPQGRFGPVTRKPAQDLTHFDRWGHSAEQPQTWLIERVERTA
jgi:nitroreductase